MRFLLDENFPLQLYRALQRSDIDAEHIVTSGLRGVPDGYLRDRLNAEEDLVLVTQDTEFEDLGIQTRGTVVISRVRQDRRIGERVEVWLRALALLPTRAAEGRLFEILDSGELALVQTRNPAERRSDRQADR